MVHPSTIAAQARRGDRVVGWKLLEADRERLLARFPPRYRRVVADHVTLAPRVAAFTPLPDALPAAIVGEADDGEGVQALVVAVGGSTDRPGGGTYHVTWSLEPGRRAKESNDVLREKGWSALAEPVGLVLRPALMP